MTKNIQRPDGDGNEHRPGLELLRSLAGYPIRSVHLSKHGVRSHVVEVHRDPFGRVIGSTERIENSEYTNLDGDWLD